MAELRCDYDDKELKLLDLKSQLNDCCADTEQLKLSIQEAQENVQRLELADLPNMRRQVVELE